jgi:hypothetical protein
MGAPPAPPPAAGPGETLMPRPPWAALAALVLAAPADAADRDAAERGRRALLGTAYNPATITFAAYDDAWKQWGLKERPKGDEYHRLFRERYGLPPAPYPNGPYPMGLRVADGPLVGRGLATDCMVCHGGSIFGTSYVGLPNSTLDFQSFVEELGTSFDGKRPKTPFVFSNVRGTTEAGGMAVFLLGFRSPNLALRLSRLELGLHDDLCEDAPAWWLLKKKTRMYHTGGGDQRSVRSLMQFMMSPLNGPDAFHKAEADFRDIREYLLSIEPPKYPLPIDRDLARQGETLFVANCARCHGTYGKEWTYPNKIVPLETIGTDRRRFDGLERRLGEYYNRSWFAHEEKGWFSDGYAALPSDGYVAPPLDGNWATAPYFHNGSVPTVYAVLNSKARPRLFTRSYRTDREDYDERHLGWKVRELAERPDPAHTELIELRKVYDTTQPGRGNGGHTFGDKLTDAERFAIIEYLKTL